MSYKNNNNKEKIFLINQNINSNKNNDIELLLESDLFPNDDKGGGNNNNNKLNVNNNKEKNKKINDKKEDILIGGLNKKERTYSIIIVCVILFFGEFCRGVIIPSINVYSYQISHLDDASLLGMIISGFSLGRFIATVALGFVSSNENYKKIFNGSIILCIVGSIWYSLCYFDNSNVKIGEFSLIASRFVIGFGAGTLSVGRSFITEVSDISERTSWMAVSSAIQFLGYAVSPIVGSFLSFIPLVFIGQIRIDSITSPGWLLVILNFILLLAIIFFFNNPKTVKIDKNSESYESPSAINITPGEITNKQVLITSESNNIEKELADKNIYKIIFKDKRILINLIIFTLLNFFIRAVMGIYETLSTYLYDELQGGDSSDASGIYDSSSTSSSDGFNPANSGSGFFFGMISFLGIFVLLFVGFLGKKAWVHDYVIFVVSNLFVCIGCFATMVHHLTWVRYVVGYIFIWIGFPVAQTIVISIFSKILSGSIGNSSQGPLLGIITASGSLGRVIGPLISGILYSEDDQLPVFGFAFGLSVFILIVSAIMIPPDIIKIKYLNYSGIEYEIEKYTSKQPLLFSDGDDDDNENNENYSNQYKI